MTIDHSLIALANKTGWDSALAGIAYPPALRRDYNEAMAASSGLPVFLYRGREGEKSAVCVLSVRKKEEDAPELVSPYGFGGMVLNEAGRGWEGFAREWRSFLGRSGFTTVYVLQHPCLPLEEGAWSPLLTGQTTAYLVDTGAGVESIWKAMAKGYRYEIRRTERDAAVRLCTDKEELGDVLLELYPHTLARVGASPVYRFSSETLRMLARSEASILAGAGRRGRIEAVVMFLYTAWTADYFINASTVEGRVFSRLLVWTAMKMLCERGVAAVNLGGGVRAGDSLDDFKRRFGGKAAGVSSIRCVLDDERYRRLCDTAGVAHQSSRYFPPYWEPS